MIHKRKEGYEKEIGRKAIAATVAALFAVTAFAAVLTATDADGNGYGDPNDILGADVSPRGIAAGFGHSLALMDDGTVWAWGNNVYGQLGDGSNTSSNKPVQVKDTNGTDPLTGVTAISTSGFHSLALMGDGTVWAWGHNVYGQLGDGSGTSSNKPVQVKDTNGTGPLTGVTAIATGNGHSLALMGDKTVCAWGSNNNGQLGDGSKTNSNKPVEVVGLEDVTAISGGFDHSLALKGDKTVWAWGHNVYGQLGDGSETDSSIPVQVKDANGTGPLTGVTEISAAEYFSLALKGDGTVWAWGHNFRGQLGNGSNTDSDIPVQVLFPIAPTITTSSLQGGTKGVAYSQTLTATGTVPITWSVAGSLPAGLTLDQAAGVISGTPSTAGTSNFTVKAVNSAGNDTKAFSITVSSAAGGGTEPKDNGDGGGGGNTMMILIAVIAIAVIAGAAAYYFIVLKKKDKKKE